MINKIDLETDSSNSRLEVTCNVQFKEISLDKVRFMGDFNIGYIDKMVLLNNPNLQLYHEEDFSKFYGFYEASNGERINFDYNFSRAQATKSRNMWVEFNPNKFPLEEMEVLTEVLFQYTNNVHITRIDLAFDLYDDLSGFNVYKHNAVSVREYWGKDGTLETRYIGSPNSAKQIRIYDKKKQLEKMENTYIEAEELWRLEVELHGKEIYNILSSLDGVDFYKPNYELIENIQERAMFYYLLSSNDNFQKVDRRTKAKYRKMIRETQDFQITQELKDYLEKNSVRLLEQMNSYLEMFNNYKKITLKPVKQ